MIRLLASLCLLSLLLAGCQAEKPGIQLQLHGGDAVAWQSYRGQWVFINYWAEWCKPCLKEIPELNRLEKESEVTVLGVNFDGVAAPELERLQGFFGIEFALLQDDPAAALSISKPNVLPATVVYNPDGQVHQTLLGPQTLETLLEAMKKPSQHQ